MSIADIFMLKDLVEHAQYHSEEFGDDFYTFFEKHYGDLKTEHQKNHQEENSQHKKLPFQHNNHLLTEAVISGNGFPQENEVVYNTANPHFYYQDLYTYLERICIFRPPKIA